MPIEVPGLPELSALDRLDSIRAAKASSSAGLLPALLRGAAAPTLGLPIRLWVNPGGRAGVRKVTFGLLTGICGRALSPSWEEAIDEGVLEPGRACAGIVIPRSRVEAFKLGVAPRDDRLDNPKAPGGPVDLAKP